jgi:hypothetical protein
MIAMGQHFAIFHTDFTLQPGLPSLVLLEGCRVAAEISSDYIANTLGTQPIVDEISSG